jgi:hypothetical protein
VTVDKVGDGRDFSLGVGATDQQDGGIFHPSVSFLETHRCHPEGRCSSAGGGISLENG